MDYSIRLELPRISRDNQSDMMLRDVVTATAKVQLLVFYGSNFYLYQAEGAYNTGMLDIMFYVTFFYANFPNMNFQKILHLTRMKQKFLH